MAQRLILVTVDDPQEDLDITHRIPRLNQGWKIEQVSIASTGASLSPNPRVTVAVVISGPARGDLDLERALTE